MRLEDYIDGLEPDEDAERRRLAREKSYAITDHLADVERAFQESVQGDSLYGVTAPSVFVGRSGYPAVRAGILSPVIEGDPMDFVTNDEWYHEGFDIDTVLHRRTGLLNSTKATNVTVNDVWDGFVGVQREVAIAEDPVNVEIGLEATPDLDLHTDGIDVETPTGPRTPASDASLAENPSVPPEVKTTLEDDAWNAEGAMTYLYRRGFDVYDVNTVLSAGALGRSEARRLVPTRWSITAVDDTIGTYLRGKIRNNPEIPGVEVHENEYLGNRYWIILAPGQWEFELVEMKAPGSIWNPDATGNVWMGAAHEGYGGRSEYVDETAGAYYAARLGVLEYLEELGRQAKCLVLREVSDDYWAPVGVWQVREAVRNAFDQEHGSAETFHAAVAHLAELLPVQFTRLRRKSTMVAGRQTELRHFE